MQNHDLKHEFPELEDKIHALKMSDNHFKKLFDEYHELNNEIHRVETGAESTSDEFLTQLRKKRVHLKDELYQMLKD